MERVTSGGAVRPLSTLKATSYAPVFLLLQLSPSFFGQTFQVNKICLLETDFPAV